MSKTFFNILVPTRNRCTTLIHCLRTLLNQNYSDYRILVCDNNSRDNTKNSVLDFKDERITYINSQEDLCMSKNWEFALRHVENGWVTFMGDDDGLLPNSLMLISEVITSTKCMAVSSAWCHYTWPHTHLANTGQLNIPIKKGFEVRDSKKWLDKLRRGTASYPELAWLYTGGFADIKIIRKCFKNSEAFFRSRTPDVYSALAITSIIEKYAYIHDPVAIAGVSSKSNGAACLGFSGRKDIKDEFFSHKNIPFHKTLGVGNVPSIRLIVYESYLQSAHIRKSYKEWSFDHQIKLAIAESQKDNQSEIYNYCKNIISLNSKSQKLPSTSQILIYRFRNLIMKAIKVFTNISIQTIPLGVQNVYDASISAATAISMKRSFRRHSILRLKQAFRQFSKYL
jgi:glycosyltransferase involved in cell wall biosynthesis